MRDRRTSVEVDRGPVRAIAVEQDALREDAPGHHRSAVVLLASTHLEAPSDVAAWRRARGAQ
jgi:hypothetical protein